MSKPIKLFPKTSYIDSILTDSKFLPSYAKNHQFKKRFKEAQTAAKIIQKWFKKKRKGLSEEKDQDHKKGVSHLEEEVETLPYEQSINKLLESSSYFKIDKSLLICRGRKKK